MCEIKEVASVSHCPPMESCALDCAFGYKTNEYKCHVCECNEPVNKKNSALETYMKEYNISYEYVLQTLQNEASGVHCQYKQGKSNG